MMDKTTEGYGATTDEIEGMLRNLCAYALSDPEPLQRYVDLTHQQVLFDGVVTAIRRERGKALGDLVALGVPMAKVAEMTKIDTLQQVKALMTAAGVPIPSMPRKKTAPAKTRSNPGSHTDANAEISTTPSAGAEPTGPADGAFRAGAPMLPTTIVPAGKRMLTMHERRALGLPDPVPISRERSMASSER